MRRCRDDAHLFTRRVVPDDYGLVREPHEGSPVEEYEAWLPDAARCLCGRYTWGEMNAILRETEMLERMVVNAR